MKYMVNVIFSFIIIGRKDENICRRKEYIPMLIEENEYLLIEEENDVIYITVLKKGFSLLDMNPLLTKHPRILINQFKALRDAAAEGKGEKVAIGELKPEIDWSVSPDLMSASIRLNCTEKDLSENYGDYLSNIMTALHEKGIAEGVLAETLRKGLLAQQEILIAQGTEPIHGKDAVITYFKRSVRKPAIKEDGKANYYDMSFLDEVKAGAWLGEKIPVTEGVPGRNILGDYIYPNKGANKKCMYDKGTVGAFKEGDKIVLRALKDGVVEFEGGKIKVGNHLIIEGDVGPETGNIDFIGSVTVKGTVMAGFAVRAERDISVLSEMGVHNIDEIVSRNGDVFIKGGIFGGGRSKIKACGSIFVKHSNDCILEAGGNIHIGYYSLGSDLKANNIITDEKKGRLIGGRAEAYGKIKAAVIGNMLERKTIIQVTGFDRSKLIEELNSLLHCYKEKMVRSESLKVRLEDIAGDESVEGKDSRWEHVQREYDEVIAEIFQYEKQRRSLIEILDAKGEGEVTIGEKAFPDTTLQIKSLSKRINQATKGTFYCQDNSMHFE
ncbi:DUF342 domain-containing protein [Bacillus sp. OV322]|uniref:DUF342 domain-containing protein n=1 Tax=Bacillus sp. OV322 TaxID=1882764 RepID=UPI00114D46C3|nr:FapA family protein [Bacillus sp. OV322]